MKRKYQYFMKGKHKINFEDTYLGIMQGSQLLEQLPVKKVINIRLQDHNFNHDTFISLSDC